jgi:hypothetical protein
LVEIEPVRQKIEPLRQDTDDLHRPSIQLERLADHGPVAAKSALPKPVTDDSDVPVFSGVRASESGLDTSHIEDLGAGIAGGEAFRFAGGSDTGREVHISELICGKRRPGTALRTPVA